MTTVPCAWAHRSSRTTPVLRLDAWPAARGARTAAGARAGTARSPATMWVDEQDREERAGIATIVGRGLDPPSGRLGRPRARPSRPRRPPATLKPGGLERRPDLRLAVDEDARREERPARPRARRAAAAASATRTPAMRLARTRSNGRARRSGGCPRARGPGARRGCGGRWPRVASTAIGSVSTPEGRVGAELHRRDRRGSRSRSRRRARARRRAARARPAPRAPARHSRVVGWRPVPNAIPGSRSMTTSSRRAAVAPPGRPDDQPAADAQDREVLPSTPRPSRPRGRPASAARRSAAGRTPGGARGPSSTLGRGALAAAAVECRHVARGRSRAGSGRSRAPSPSSTSSNAGSTHVPPGATRPRISLTASTASRSASTESSSHVPPAARAVARSPARPRQHRRACPSLSRSPPLADRSRPIASAYASSSSRSLPRELRRDLDVDEHVQVAALAGATQVRHALAAQADLGPRLRARP